MREGSGWTYQQIADHEGVEIGTIETLLWRARQALKREFNVLSESKGAFGGFLAGAGALVRRSVLRAAHKAALLQPSGGAGGLRNAIVGVTVTSAAVAAALITPHALSTSHPSEVVPLSAPAGSNLAVPSFPAAQASPDTAATDPGTAPSDRGGSSSDSGPLALAGGAARTPDKSTILQGGLPSGPTSGPAGSGPFDSSNLPTLPGASALAPVISGLGDVTSTVTNAVTGLATTLGLATVLSQLGLVPAADSASSTTTSTTAPSLLSGVTGAVNSTLKSLLGQK
jgi:hypothetical protein